MIESVVSNDTVLMKYFEDVVEESFTETQSGLEVGQDHEKTELKLPVIVDKLDQHFRPLIQQKLIDSGRRAIRFTGYGLAEELEEEIVQKVSVIDERRVVIGRSVAATAASRAGEEARDRH